MKITKVIRFVKISKCPKNFEKKLLKTVGQKSPNLIVQQITGYKNFTYNTSNLT